MPTHKAGADWILCVELDGLVVTVIVDDKLAEVIVPPTLTFAINSVIVDVDPNAKVVPLETEYYYDDYKRSWEHFFDVLLADEPATFYASVSGGLIKHLERLF